MAAQGPWSPPKVIITVGLVLLGALMVLGISYGIWLTYYKNSSLSNVESGEAAERIIESSTKATLPAFSSNPLEEKPNLNPAEQSNPITTIKTNPFE